ncbi:glucuronyl hydrolase [Streptococcus pneumoniae]|nr:glucuronyl hydrolase [Streptococcus pneumoniae]
MNQPFIDTGHNNIWHSGKGVDEGNIWGDYYYLEALIRFYKDWNLYW